MSATYNLDGSAGNQGVPSTMLFLVCLILVIIALAKTIQAQSRTQVLFSGIPDKILVGSELEIGFQYSGSSTIGGVLFGIVRDGESVQHRSIRVRFFSTASQSLKAPLAAGTYRVQATYDDSSGNTRRDLSDSFVVFAEGEDSGDLPSSSSTATLSSTTSEPSTQSTNESLTTITEQTTSGSSTSITTNADATRTGTITNTSSSVSTGMDSIDTEQPTTSTSSATPSNAVSSRNSKSSSKAAIIAGSVVGTATLIALLVLVAVRRRYKKMRRGDRLSAQPYTFYGRFEKQPRKKEIEGSEREEVEDGIRGASSEVPTNRARQSMVVQVVHEDSGWRPDQIVTVGDVRIEDLPPDYDAAR